MSADVIILTIFQPSLSLVEKVDQPNKPKTLFWSKKTRKKKKQLNQPTENGCYDAVGHGLKCITNGSRAISGL